MDYTIIGSGVNLASRLEAATPPGTILISHETYVLVKDRFCCEERQPLSVKGMGDPVENYRVIDEWDKLPERESVIREDLPAVKLEVNLRTMSNGDREQTVAALQRALRRLESSGATLRQADVADYTRIQSDSWTSQLAPQTPDKV